MRPDSSDKILNIYIAAHESQKGLFFAEQRANGGKTKLYVQSNVWLEDFSGLTDGNKVDRGGNKVEKGATAWSRAACACDTGAACVCDTGAACVCDACNLHIYIAYKQRNWGNMGQTIRS